MSIASRLFNIARAELEERLRRLETRHGLPGDETPGSSAGNERGGDPSWRSQGAATDSGKDPDMARWYANLEVPYGSDFETVQAAWKKLVRDYHPDRHGQDAERHATATEILKELNNAYEQLKKRLDKS